MSAGIGRLERQEKYLVKYCSSRRNNLIKNYCTFICHKFFHFQSTLWTSILTGLLCMRKGSMALKGTCHNLAMGVIIIATIDKLTLFKYIPL